MKLINEAKRFQKLAGLLTEGEIEEMNNIDEGEKSKIQSWIDGNAGGYGPSEDEEPEEAEKMKQELNALPQDDPQSFIDKAVSIIFEYTKDYYGDDTTFSPDDIKEDFDKYLKGEGLDEMARTAGTGGSYTITPEGEAALKQAKATNQLPEGLKGSQLAILIFLFKAKKEGKRVQKIDYAAEKGVPQPAVNALFNELEAKGLTTKEGYTSAQKEPSVAKPKADLAAVLADLELD